MSLSSNIHQTDRIQRRINSTTHIKEYLSQMNVKLLSSIELLGLLLGARYGQDNEVHTIAKQIFNEWNGLRGLRYATYHHLCSIRGIGSIKASRILAAIELGLRISHEIQSELPLTHPQNSEQAWVHRSRQLWLNKTTTVLATVDRSFNEALTLSLDQGLEDSKRFELWIKRLILHSSSTSHCPSWTLFFLRDRDDLTEKEIRNSQKIYELAQCLNLALRELYVISHTRYWRLTSHFNNGNIPEIRVSEGEKYDE